MNAQNIHCMLFEFLAHHIGFKSPPSTLAKQTRDEDRDAYMGVVRPLLAAACNR